MRSQRPLGEHAIFSPFYQIPLVSAYPAILNGVSILSLLNAAFRTEGQAQAGVVGTDGSNEVRIDSHDR